MAAAFTHKSHLLHDRERRQKIQGQRNEIYEAYRGTCGPTLSGIGTDHLSVSEAGRLPLG
jgi:hypothetical protein